MDWSLAAFIFLGCIIIYKLGDVIIALIEAKQGPSLEYSNTNTDVRMKIKGLSDKALLESFEKMLIEEKRPVDETGKQ